MTQPGRNDPCPCGSGKKYKHCHFGKPDDPWAKHGTVVTNDDPYDYYVPPPAGIVAIPNDFRPELLDLRDDDLDFEPGEFTSEPMPLDEAWALVDDAWDNPDDKVRKRLAKNALKLSKDCAGAYLILGDSEPDVRKRAELFTQAIQTAERVLAPQDLADLASWSWDDPEIETAMYALLHRSLALISLGDEDGSLDDLERMIEIDPTDRLGARPIMMLSHLAFDDYYNAEQVVTEDRLAASDPVSLFGLALARFRRSCDSPFARRALSDAIFEYPDMVETLSTLPPVPMADLQTPAVAERVTEALLDVAGEELDESDEAVSRLDAAPVLYKLMQFFEFWQETEGATEWLCKVYAAGPRIRYDNGNLGAGPGFRFFAQVEHGPRRCPQCRGKTEAHTLTLVLEFSLGDVLDIDLAARRCGHCDLVIVDLYDVQLKMLPASIASPTDDFVPLGYIDEVDRASRPQGGSDEAWLREHMKPFSKLDDGDWERETWPTLEEKQALLEQMLAETGLDSLLGSLAELDYGLPGGRLR